MSRAAHRWRRGDGTVLSCLELAQAVPLMLDELDDIKGLVNLLQQWLLFEETACYLLTDWLIAVDANPGHNPSAQTIIDQLATLGTTLHRILQAGTPDTGHAHPPALSQGR